MFAPSFIKSFYGVFFVKLVIRVLVNGVLKASVSELWGVGNAEPLVYIQAHATVPFYKMLIFLIILFLNI